MHCRWCRHCERCCLPLLLLSSLSAYHQHAICLRLKKALYAQTTGKSSRFNSITCIVSVCADINRICCSFSTIHKFIIRCDAPVSRYVICQCVVMQACCLIPPKYERNLSYISSFSLHGSQSWCSYCFAYSKPLEEQFHPTSFEDKNNGRCIRLHGEKLY